MSEQKRKTVYLRGKLFWAKIFGNPRPNYDGDALEWSLEFEPDAQSTQILTDEGLDDRIRDRRGKKGYEDREPFVILRRKELKYDGTKNEHIRVVDASNNDWNDKVLIGNGTDVDLKVTIVDYGPRKKLGIYPTAIRVLELVPYHQEEFAPLDEKDRFYKKSSTATPDFEKDFGLDGGDEEENAPAVEEQPEQKPVRKPRTKPTFDTDLDDDVPF